MFEAPIKRIRIDSLLPTVMGEGTLVEWEVDDKYCSRNLEFAVIWGRNPTDEFQKVGTTRDTWIVDPVEHREGVDREVYYAVVVRDRDTGERWNSLPQRSGSNWAKQHWRIAREIVRQWRVRLTRSSIPGTRGYLIKRRNYGDPCLECRDEHTGKVLKTNCDVCYGTGIIGGYYTPMETMVDQNPEVVHRKLTSDGMLKEKVSSWHVLAYPRFEPNDFWVDASQNLRYKIQSDIETIGHVAGVPLVQRVEVSLAERSSSIYNFPVTDDG